jgi:hypothetical protein
MTDVVAAYNLIIAPTTGAQTHSVGINLGWSKVTQILIVFPPGPSGLVGVRIEYGSTPVYPNNSGSYFVADNYVIEIPVTNQEQGGTWAARGYNNDEFTHVIPVWFYYDYINATDTSNSGALVSLL